MGKSGRCCEYVENKWEWLEMGKNRRFGIVILVFVVCNLDLMESSGGCA